MKRLLKRLLKPIVMDIVREERSKDVTPTYVNSSFLSSLQEELVAALSHPGLPEDTDQGQAQVQADPEDPSQSDSKPSSAPPDSGSRPEDSPPSPEKRPPEPRD